MTGINLSDGALNPKKTKLNEDYTYPTIEEIDHFTERGFRVFRLPVLSKRLLPGPEQSRSPDWAIVLTLIDHAKARGAGVILDLHQYGSMSGRLVGRDPDATGEFVTFWKEIAERLKDRPNVIFGLMNEPNKQSAAEWLPAANAAIAAIRSTGARQLILVPGSYWDGASKWTRTSNAEVMAGVADPANQYAYEVHQYLDKYSTGTTQDVAPGSGATALTEITSWARSRSAKLFLGEFGFASTPEAMKEGRDLVAYMAANKDVWCGWTYWAAGRWWGNYMFSVEPTPAGGDRPQLAVLQEHR